MTTKDGYTGMKKNGINIRVPDGMMYKPPGFWISVNYGWEEWSSAEGFQQHRDNIQCNVFINPNLTFIRISTIEQANELVRFLLPDMKNYYPEFHRDISDLINFSRYGTEIYNKTGKKLGSLEAWKKALESCDGIYYENSWELHMDTIFNTWDCDSLVLFDPRNVISLQKQ